MNREPPGPQGVVPPDRAEASPASLTKRTARADRTRPGREQRRELDRRIAALGMRSYPGETKFPNSRTPRRTDKEEVGG